MNTKKAFNHKY